MIFSEKVVKHICLFLQFYSRNKLLLRDFIPTPFPINFPKATFIIMEAFRLEVYPRSKLSMSEDSQSKILTLIKMF